jgi:hypothetical protein
MNPGIVRVARGWRDDELPVDVKRALEAHDGHDKRGALCLHAQSGSGQFKGASDVPFYSASRDIEVLGYVMEVLVTFLGYMNRDDVDSVTLTFLNFKPDTFSLSARPESVVTDAPSLLEGLGWFCQSVAGSIRGEGMWSLCEWAYVSVARKHASSTTTQDVPTKPTREEPDHGSTAEVFRFVGGEYDGKELSVDSVNKHATIIPVNGDLGNRLFLLMPPVTFWGQFLKTRVEAVHAYERVFTERGPEFHAAPAGSIDKALSEAKIRADTRAKAALDTLAYSDRNRVIDQINALQNQQPHRWPPDKVAKLKGQERTYILSVPPHLRVLFKLIDKSDILLVDVLHKDTIDSFLRSQGIAGVQG